MENAPETLDKIKSEIRERLLAIRCLERLVESDEFCIAYEKAKESSQIEVSNLIANSKIAEIKKWVVKQNSVNDHGELPLRELRLLAQRLGVPFYSRLPKASLLSEITRHEKLRNGIVST